MAKCHKWLCQVAHEDLFLIWEFLRAPQQVVFQLLKRIQDGKERYSASRAALLCVKEKWDKLKWDFWRHLLWGHVTFIVILVEEKFRVFMGVRGMVFTNVFPLLQGD